MKIFQKRRASTRYFGGGFKRGKFTSYVTPMKRSIVKYKYSDGSSRVYHRVQFAKWR